MYTLLAYTIATAAYGMYVLFSAFQRCIDGVSIFAVSPAHSWVGSWASILVFAIAVIVLFAWIGVLLGLRSAEAYDSLKPRHRRTVNFFLRRAARLAYGEIARSNATSRNRWLSYFIKVLSPALKS